MQKISLEERLKMSILNNYIKYEKNKTRNIGQEIMRITKYGLCVIRKELNSHYMLNQYKTVDFYYNKSGIALHFKKDNGSLTINDSCSRYFYLQSDFVMTNDLADTYFVTNFELQQDGSCVLTLGKKTQEERVAW